MQTSVEVAVTREWPRQWDSVGDWEKEVERVHTDSLGEAREVAVRCGSEERGNTE